MLNNVSLKAALVIFLPFVPAAGFLIAYFIVASSPVWKAQTVLVYETPTVPKKFQKKLKYPNALVETENSGYQIVDGKQSYLRLHRKYWDNCLAVFYKKLEDHDSKQPLWLVAGTWPEPIWRLSIPLNLNEATKAGWDSCVSSLKAKSMEENELREKMYASAAKNRRFLLVGGIMFSGMGIFLILRVNSSAKTYGRPNNGATNLFDSHGDE